MKNSLEFVKIIALPVSRFFISLISLHVFSPAQLFRAPRAFQELLAYQALTVVTAQRENEETLVLRENRASKEKLVPRPFQTGNSVFGKGAMAGILD